MLETFIIQGEKNVLEMDPGETLYIFAIKFYDTTVRYLTKFLL